ncbi:MAG TPA: class I SAM-dependent methyltransferase [bacterium]|nr:class I SAM-dependent methyltransferase [bacterium]
MRSPWLDIPLADYERHMSLPRIGQAQMLANQFEFLLRQYAPASVAVIGCAGGNGFDRIALDTTSRVVGVDINPAYIDETRVRFSGRFRSLELYSGDIQTIDVIFEPVELIYAALVFEYVDLPSALARMRSLTTPDGVLGIILQLPSPTVSSVTPSPFPSLQLLAPIMRLVSPEKLRTLAEDVGFRLRSSRRIDLCSGKCFQVQAFRAQATTSVVEDRS